MTSPNEQELKDTLFPNGTQFDESKLPVLIEQYKLFVNTSEKLVARRQTVNTFFLSINALILSAMGLIFKEIAELDTVLIGVTMIGVAGILLCESWRRLVRSFTQLNRGKFDVIHLLEQHLPASLFKAEWKALGEGEDKNKYTPFTRIENNIPRIFTALYLLIIIGIFISWLYTGN